MYHKNRANTQNLTDGTPLLTYSLNSDPFPIQSSTVTSGYPPNLANVTINFNDANYNPLYPIYFSSLEISIPIGLLASDLSTNSAMSVNFGDGSDNQLQLDYDSGIISVTTVSGNPIVFSNNCTLYLSGIDVNIVPGNAALNFNENTGTSANAMSNKSGILNVTKVSPSKTLVEHFVATASSISAGQSIFLSWQCQPNANHTLSLSWPGQAAIDVTHMDTGTGNLYRYPIDDTITLNADTMFTLVSTYHNASGDLVKDNYQYQVTVTSSASAQIERFVCKKDVIQLGEMAHLQWKVNASTAYCHLYQGPSLIAANLKELSYKHQPESSIDYALKAYNHQDELEDVRSLSVHVCEINNQSLEGSFLPKPSEGLSARYKNVLERLIAEGHPTTSSHSTSSHVQPLSFARTAQRQKPLQPSIGARNEEDKEWTKISARRSTGS